MKKIVIIIATLLCAASCENAVTFEAHCVQDTSVICLDDGSVYRPMYACKEGALEKIENMYCGNNTKQNGEIKDNCFVVEIIDGNQNPKTIPNGECFANGLWCNNGAVSYCPESSVCNKNKRCGHCMENDIKCEGTSISICREGEWDVGVYERFVCQNGKIRKCENDVLSEPKGCMEFYNSGFRCLDDSINATDAYICQDDYSCNSDRDACGECINGDRDCENGTPRLCQSGEWNEQEKCGEGQKCDNGECKGTPNENNCTTDMCDGEKIRICKNGILSPSEECGEGKICDKGECNDPKVDFCRNESKRCNTEGIPQICNDGFWKDEAPCGDGMSCKEGVCESSTETATCTTGYISCINNKKCDNNKWISIVPDLRHSIICNYCKEKTSSGISYVCGDAIFTCREENHYTVKGQSNSDASIKICGNPCSNNVEDEITCIDDVPKIVCVGNKLYEIDNDCKDVFDGRNITLEPDRPKSGCYRSGDKLYSVSASASVTSNYTIELCYNGSAPQDGLCDQCPNGDCKSNVCDSANQDCSCTKGTYQCSNGTPQMCDNRFEKWNVHNKNLLVFEAAKNENDDEWKLTLKSVCYYPCSGVLVNLECTLQETKKGTLNDFMNNNGNTVLLKPTGSCDFLIKSKYTIYIHDLYKKFDKHICSKEDVWFTYSPNNSITLHAN